MVAHMIASCVRDMPGVMASGSTKEGAPVVFIAMRTNKGYAMTVVAVAEHAGPIFDVMPTEYHVAQESSTTLLDAARRRYGDICPECNVPWQTASPDCPHQEFDLHPRPYQVSTSNPYGYRGMR